MPTPMEDGGGRPAPCPAPLRRWALVVITGPEVGVSRTWLEGYGAPDIATVDDLARILLWARRTGQRVRLERVESELGQLIELSGLGAELYPSSARGPDNYHSEESRRSADIKISATATDETGRASRGHQQLAHERYQQKRDRLQSRAQLPQTVAAVPEPAGFMLVQEEDVAFTLSLCREVNRIYGQYQDGDLAARDSLGASLMMTLRLLGALSFSVSTGMPSMRIAVAMAQAREMLAVMFDRDPPIGAVDPDWQAMLRSELAGAVGVAPIAVAAIEPPQKPSPPHQSRLIRLIRHR